ncbi:MAG: rhomboid family intramembrane serine protease [Bacteroidetes bacterium]|nr:rhomboid family intramembrane serine protease [Bacteroidota bacterium]
MKIHYNAPVILTFSLIAFAVMMLSTFTGGMTTTLLFTAWPSDLFNPLSYVRMFTHVLGHISWEHLFGNLTLILLIGPLLEEKYGSNTMLIMMTITALFTGIIVTFIIIVALFLGKEFLASFKPDTISQFAHILGGICGCIFGFIHTERKQRGRKS